MGGDFGPHCVVPACLQCLADHPSLHLVLVGQHAVLAPLLVHHHAKDHPRLQIVHAEDVIDMHDKPSHVLRNKPDASMRVALNLVRDKQAQACVSAGNTGALMALSRQVLKTIDGIDRPAMATLLPTMAGHCLVLDLGANIACTGGQLAQFAAMGAVAAEVSGIERPRVALLNVGVEALKGTEQVRHAAELLEQMPSLNYTGFIEGDGVYRGDADVVVCDGFVGNVLLKSSEGLARMIAHKLSALFERSLWSRLVGFLAEPLLGKLRQDLAPGQHNGASLLGLQGIVVKSHGSADIDAFKAAITRALLEIKEDLPARLQGRVEQYLPRDVTSRSG